MALYRIGCHRNFHCRNKLIFLKVLGTNRYLQAFDPNEREKAITILLQSSSLWKNVLIRKVQLQPFPSDSSLLLTSAFTASEQNYHVRDGFEKGFLELSILWIAIKGRLIQLTIQWVLLCSLTIPYACLWAKHFYPILYLSKPVKHWEEQLMLILFPSECIHIGRNL